MAKAMTIEKRTMAIILFFVVVAAAIIGLILFPAIREIKRAKQSVEQLYEFMERRHRKVASVRIALKKIKEIKQTLAEYPNYLFKQGDQLKLITDLEQVAARHNVEQKINHSNLDGQIRERVELSVSVAGAYHNVLSYLSEIERLPYFLTVQGLQMSPVTDRNKAAAAPPRVLLTLDVILYAY